MLYYRLLHIVLQVLHAVLQVLHVVLQVLHKSLEPNMQFTLKTYSDVPDSSINCAHYDSDVKCSPSACLGHINLSEVLKCSLSVNHLTINIHTNRNQLM